jgi:hypothetical protein
LRFGRIVNRGDVYLVRHAWIILSDPSKFPQQIVVANLTTCYGSRTEDRSCILNTGDHPFVNRETRIEYARAKLETLGSLIVQQSTNILRFIEPASEALIARVLKGAETTGRIPGEVEAALISQKLIPPRP